MDRKAEFIGGDKVALWYCRECNESGALNVDREDVYSVIAGMTSHHSMISPGCHAEIGESGMRLIKPIGWYRAAREGYLND